MNKDNIQELLKPRYKVIADYPYSIHKLGTIIQNEGQDWIDGVRYYKCADFPHLFRRLKWWEDRDVKGMPKYLKSNPDDKDWAGNLVVEKVNEFYGDNNEYVAIDRDETLQYCTSWYLPATETEYLNQNQKP